MAKIDIFSTPDVHIHALMVEFTESENGRVARVIGADEFEIFLALARYVDNRTSRLQVYTKKHRRRGMRQADYHDLWCRACREIK